MARESDAGKASDDVIQKLVDALDERNDHMSDLIKVANEVDDSVQALRKDVFRRPTREEVSHKRRVAAAIAILCGYLLLSVSGVNVNSCSPGTKASKIVDEIAKGKVKDRAAYDKLVQGVSSPAWCDVAFPLHKHEGRDPYPTNRNLLGFGLLFTAGAMIAVYARGPRGWEPHRSVED